MKDIYCLAIESSCDETSMSIIKNGTYEVATVVLSQIDIHALYGEYIGVFDLGTHEMTDGDLPLKAQSLVKEWLSINDKELQKMWDSQKIVKLPPLE